MKRGISPGNMPQVFSWGGYQSILNPAVFPGVQFVLGEQLVNGVQFRTSFVTIRNSSETKQKKLRSASTEVSGNNMLTTILRPFIDNKG